MRHGYTARLANEIEARWQDRWERERTFSTPNPVGPLTEGFEQISDRPKFFVRVAARLSGRRVHKVAVVPGRLVNFVVG